MQIKSNTQLKNAVKWMLFFHNLKSTTLEQDAKYLAVNTALKNAPSWLKSGEAEPSEVKARVIKMTTKQEAEHNQKHNQNHFIKHLEGEKKLKTKAQQFKEGIQGLFSKTKAVTLADAQIAVTGALNTEIVQGDALYQPAFEELLITEASSVEDSQLIRLSAAQVNHRAEQDGTDPIQAQNIGPKYERPITNHSAVTAKHVISREAVNDPHVNVLQDVLQGVGEEGQEVLSSELFIGVGSDGNEPELAGITTIKADLANAYTEALKSDKARNVNVFKVALSGVNNSIGNTEPASPNSSVDNLVDLVQSLPAKFKSRAKWYGEADELAQIMKIKDSTGSSIYDASSRSVLGFPFIEIDGFRAVGGNGTPVNEQDIRLAFGVLSEAVAIKHVEPSGEQSSELILDEYSNDGGLVVKSHKTYINYTKANKALRLLAAKA